MDGIQGHLEFLALLRSGNDELRERAKAFAGRAWFREDDKENTNERLHRWFRF